MSHGVVHLEKELLAFYEAIYKWLFLSLLNLYIFITVNTMLSAVEQTPHWCWRVRGRVAVGDSERIGGVDTSTRSLDVGERECCGVDLVFDVSLVINEV
jgi:hypothetical protein